jgi:hypothetical protein
VPRNDGGVPRKERGTCLPTITKFGIEYERVFASGRSLKGQTGIVTLRYV